MHCTSQGQPELQAIEHDAKACDNGLPKICLSTPYTSVANGLDAAAKANGATNVLGTGCNSG